MALDLLRRARREAAPSLGARANVVGTALGQKRTDGELREDDCLIVIVEKKVAKSRLSAVEHIPERIHVNGHSIETDVIELESFRLEYRPAPFATSDNKKKGTVAAFARDEYDEFALTCAHCVRGLDGSPYTPSEVKFWERSKKEYVRVGTSARAQSWPGNGRAGSFGFSDAALIRLETAEAKACVLDCSPLPIWRSIRSGVEVTGQTYGGAKVGVIEALEVICRDIYADLLIRMDSDGTRPGDSGMMWRTRSGNAVGMHAMGNGKGSGMSSVSLAMAAYRLPEELGVTLLDPSTC